VEGAALIRRLLPVSDDLLTILASKALLVA
jgi:hypothetical protein